MIRPSKKEISFLSELFFRKEEGGPYYLLVMDLLLFFEDGRHVLVLDLDTHRVCGFFIHACMHACMHACIHTYIHPVQLF